MASHENSKYSKRMYRREKEAGVGYRLNSKVSNISEGAAQYWWEI